MQYVQLSDEVLTLFNRHEIYKAEAFTDLLPVLQQAVEQEKKILIVCNRVVNFQNWRID